MCMCFIVFCVFAMMQNGVIRRVFIDTGEVRTLSGNGTSSFADGSSAASRFDIPVGIAMTATSAVVCDQFNHVIRLISLCLSTASQTQTMTASLGSTLSSTGTRSSTSSPSSLSSQTASQSTSLSPTQAWTGTQSPSATGTQTMSLPSPVFSFPGYSTAGFLVENPAGVSFVSDWRGNARSAGESNGRRIPHV